MLLPPPLPNPTPPTHIHIHSNSFYPHHSPAAPAPAGPAAPRAGRELLPVRPVQRIHALSRPQSRLTPLSTTGVKISPMKGQRPIKVRPTDASADVPGKSIGEVICSWVRQGAFPHVAASAAGVAPEVWKRWLEAGKKALRQSAPYYKFFRELEKAKAQARIRAEIAVFDADPKTWLRSGPGKETADSAGWTTLVKPAIMNQQQINILASPEWNQLWAHILGVLGSFPDARTALADALIQFDKHNNRTRALEEPAWSQSGKDGFTNDPKHPSA